MVTFQALQELTKPKELSTIRKDLKGIEKVDTRNGDWKYTIIKALSQYGFKKLGSGKYAVVFSHPKLNYVVKIFMKDTAFLKWYKFCIANPDNPYCPKFRGKITPINKMFYSVRIEKLSQFDGNFFEEDLIDAAKAGDKHAKKVSKFLDENRKFLDLHSENVMMRGQQIVIIDPFYNWFKSDTGYITDPDDFDLTSV